MKKIKYILFLSIIVVICSDCMEEVFPTMSKILKLIKYGTAGVTFVICGSDLLHDFLKHAGKSYLFYEETKKFCVVFVYFVIISISEICMQKQFTYKTVEELVQLMLPFAYTFFVVNSLRFEDIFSFMKLALTVSFGSYIIVNMSAFTNFFINLSSISLSNSYSPFESSSFAEISAGLMVFFLYYRKKCPGWAALSVIFVFFTFKRVLMLQCLLLIIVCIFNWQNVRIPAWWIKLSTVIGVVGTLLFNYLIQVENSDLFYNLFGTSSGDFTMGRNYRIWYHLASFESYGFGSTSAALGHNLELDLVKILMEIGLIGLILFIWCYFSLGRKNLYTYVVIGSMLLNLLFASGLTSSVGWIFRMIALGVILYDQSDRVGVEDVRKPKIRFVIR